MTYAGAINDERFVRAQGASLIASILAALAGVSSTILLAKGSDPVPWVMQSWSGKSKPELDYRAKARRYYVGGMIGLGMAFVLSAVAAICSFYAPV